MLMEYFDTGVPAVFYFIFSMVIISGMLEPKSKKRIWLKWAAFGVLGLAAVFGFELLYDLINEFVAAYEEARGGEITQFGNIVLSLGNFVRHMVPGAAVLLGILFLYKEKWEEKVFITLFVLLVEEIILNVFCEITNLPFSTGVTDNIKDYPPMLIRYLIIVFWMGISVIVFRKFVRELMQKTMERIKGEIGKFLKLPIASYIVFIAVLVVIDLLSINFRSANPGNSFVAIVVIVGMTGMYIFMYSALFNAVTISAESAKVRADLEVASNIQRSALPATFPAFPDKTEFDIFASMRPAKEVGGDFYDFFMIDEDHLALVIADVSGKGVPAALFMMAGKTTIRNQAVSGAEPGEVLANSNMQLLENNEQGLFITAFFAVLNIRTGQLRFSNAGHNTPYICRQDGSIEGLKMRRGFVLGGMEGIRYRTEETVLKAGEKILLYTDGVTEANDTKWELYGDDRLIKVLEAESSKSAEDIIACIGRSVDAFAEGAEQADDITMLMAEYRGV